MTLDAAEEEEWRQVVHVPVYEVSSWGRLRRTFGDGRPPRYRTLSPGYDGYPLAGLYWRGKVYSQPLHRLVCLAFHGPPPTPRHEVGHRDGNRSNSRADNLRWVTRAENSADRFLHGTALIGERHPAAKLTAANVAEIRAASRYRGLLRDLANKFGVTKSYISRLRTRGGSRWSQVPLPGSSVEKEDA